MQTASGVMTKLKTMYVHVLEAGALTGEWQVLLPVPRGVPQIAVRGSSTGLLRRPASRINVASTMTVTSDASGLRLTACVPSVQCRFPGGRATWRLCT